MNPIYPVTGGIMNPIYPVTGGIMNPIYPVTGEMWILQLEVEISTN
jgi:hypothetical protein